MGVIKRLEEILALTFQLPIVQDINQTKVERAIGYRIARDRIRTVADSRQHHEVSAAVTLRSENGYDALGWMSAKLAAGMPSGADWRIMAVGSEESVDYVSQGEILISLDVTIKMTVIHDQVKEVIKTINMETNTNV